MQKFAKNEQNDSNIFSIKNTKNEIAHYDVPMTFGTRANRFINELEKTFESSFEMVKPISAEDRLKSISAKFTLLSMQIRCGIACLNQKNVNAVKKYKV